MSEPTQDRYTVRSVAHAITVLDTLGADDAEAGLGLTEIAARTGLSKSAAYAILHTFQSSGYVIDSGSGRTRRYFLGMKLARLGTRARSQLSVPDVARPELERLAHRIGHSVRIGVIDSDGVDVVDRCDADHGIRIDLRMGSHELLHTTAVGKAILATWPDHEVSQILGSEPLVSRTAHSLTTVAAVLADLVEVRDRGWAVDDEQDHLGIVCLGASIRVGDDARTTWAISTTMLKAAVDDDERARIGAALRATAESISHHLRAADPPLPS